MNTAKPLVKDASKPGASFSPLLRKASTVISFVFHPLFIPVYLYVFLLYIQPAYPLFNATDRITRMRLLIQFVMTYTGYPLITVFLGKGLGFIDSVYLRTQKDRIIPYIACGLFYFWNWHVLRKQPELSGHLLIMLSLAIFLASSLGLIINSFVKISMHTISAGVMATFVLLFGLMADINLGFYIAVAFLVAGLISTARLITNDHRPAEIYLGLFVGFLAQLVARMFV